MCTYVQDMKFLWRNLWLRLSTDDANDDAEWQRTTDKHFVTCYGVWFNAWKFSARDWNKPYKKTGWIVWNNSSYFIKMVLNYSSQHDQLDANYLFTKFRNDHCFSQLSKYRLMFNNRLNFRISILKLRPMWINSVNTEPEHKIDVLIKVSHFFNFFFLLQLNLS